ncbi:MAG TPA: AraC family transcriptional regulator [Opitutaceae bacterium]|nr:helix-turn-helix domain-containing protein [Opitutaceae bacterium]HRE05139.1 AraC family transcriptional regulator [Opitutaceae bacterium]
MSPPTDSALPSRRAPDPSEPVTLYAMSAYTSGIRKPGHFHLLRFDENQSERINRYVPHRHDFYEIIWLPVGRGVVQSDFRTFPVQDRTLLVTSPGQIHAWQTVDPLEGEILSFTREFFLVSAEQPGLLGRLPFLQATHPTPVLTLDEEEGARMDRTFQHLRQDASEAAPGRDDLVRAYITIILTLIRQAYQRRAPAAAFPPSDSETLAQRFRMALEEHFPSMLEVGDYATLLQVSRSHLNDDLRRATGHSASEIIHERILLEAKRLLIHSSLNVSEIAYHLRFQDPSYFGRFFRKATGQSPGTYRDDAHRNLLAS